MGRAGQPTITMLQIHQSVLLLFCMPAVIVFCDEDIETRGSCVDLLENCSKLSYQQCRSGRYASWARKNCCKSCRFGSGTGGGSSGGSSGERPVTEGTCGRSSKLGTSSFIVGGREAIPHSLPWQVGLQYYTGAPFCGGTIINKYWIVTAAHCISFQPGPVNIYNKYIRVGAHYSKTGGVKHKIAKAIVHEKYNKKDKSDHNDIALIKVAGSGIKLSTHAMPACLPPRGYKWPSSTKFIVSGWGRLKSDEKTSPSKLQQVEVPLYPHSKCYGGKLKKVVCAGLEKGGKDSCQGDSGGPLVAKYHGKWTLAGVVSWGRGCAGAKKPGVYTDVAQYIDWIRKNAK